MPSDHLVEDSIVEASMVVEEEAEEVAEEVEQDVAEGLTPELSVEFVMQQGSPAMSTRATT